MTTDVQPVKALYYPRTHFTSPTWLKAALLYWERIVRIVPDGFSLLDPPDVHELAAEGLVQNVSPAPYRDAAKKRFLRRLEHALSKREALFSANGSRAGAPRRSYQLIAIDKVERGLLQELQAHGLASVSEDWVTMSSELADMYLVALANEIARSLYAAPATDTSPTEVPSTFLAQQELSGDRSPEVPIDGYACARTIGPFRAIEGSSVPADRILRIRQRCSDERRAFRELIQDRAVAIAGLHSTQAIDAHLRDLAFELEGEASAQRRSRTASYWRDAGRVLGVGAPASIGAVVTLSGAPALVAALGGVGSVAAGITEWIVDRRQARHAVQYLLCLEGVVGNLRPASRDAGVRHAG
jgi:hypothetical protein